MNERIVQFFSFIEENKKLFGGISIALLFGKKIYTKVMMFINTGKKILTAIEETSQKIDTLQSDVNMLKQEAAITNELIKASKDLEDIGIFDANHRGEITWVNSYLLRKLGVQREDFLKYRWTDYLEKHSRDAVTHIWKEKVMNEDKIYIETMFYDKNGTIMNVSITAHPVNVNDEIHGYTGTMKIIE